MHISSIFGKDYIILILIALILTGSLTYLTINTISEGESVNRNTALLDRSGGNELEYYGLKEVLERIHSSSNLYVLYGGSLVILFTEGNLTKYLMSIKSIDKLTWAIVEIEGVAKTDIDPSQNYKNNTSCKLHGVGPIPVILKARVLDVLHGNESLEDKEIHLLYIGMHYGKNGDIVVSELMPILPNKTYLITINRFREYVKTPISYKCKEGNSTTIIEQSMTYFKNVYTISFVNIFLYKDGRLYFIYYDELIKNVDEDYAYLLTYKINREGAIRYTKNDPLIVNGMDIDTFRQLLQEIIENKISNQ